jgi:hypothetical protein
MVGMAGKTARNALHAFARPLRDGKARSERARAVLSTQRVVTILLCLSIGGVKVFLLSFGDLANARSKLSFAIE